MSDDDGGSPLPADDRSSVSTNGNPQVQTVLEEADENTLRVMLSTDNHLGYAERDPVRGM
jgi:double-strand break repair protein MRE11